MNRWLKGLNRIEFLVTEACTGACKHCSQGGSRGNRHIDQKLAADAVQKICSNWDIQSVMTFGGEPLLQPETVCSIHRAATEMGVPKRQLITNGYFTKDEQQMRMVARNLAQSGVNDLLLSVDVFHQETIPVETVKTFAAVCRDVGLPVRIQPAWLISREADNPYNRKTQLLLTDFRYLGFPISEGNVVFFEGNARRYLKDYFALHPGVKNPYYEDPKELTSISLEADGTLLQGNVYRQDVLEILKSYDPEKGLPPEIKL